MASVLIQKLTPGVVRLIFRVHQAYVGGEVNDIFVPEGDMRQLQRLRQTVEVTSGLVEQRWKRKDKMKKFTNTSVPDLGTIAESMILSEIFYIFDDIERLSFGSVTIFGSENISALMKSFNRLTPEEGIRVRLNDVAFIGRFGGNGSYTVWEEGNFIQELKNGNYIISAVPATTGLYLGRITSRELTEDDLIEVVEASQSGLVEVPTNEGSMLMITNLNPDEIFPFTWKEPYYFHSLSYISMNRKEDIKNEDRFAEPESDEE